MAAKKKMIWVSADEDTKGKFKVMVDGIKHGASLSEDNAKRVAEQLKADPTVLM